MKKFIFVSLLLLSMSSTAEVFVGPGGIWYGNICMTQQGWFRVAPQPVGSMCYDPRFGIYGTIVNR